MRIFYTARKTPAGYLGYIEMHSSRSVHTQELYESRPSLAVALNDVSNLAWSFADRLGNR